MEINAHIRGLRSLHTGELVEPDFSRPIGLHGGHPLVVEYDLAELSRTPLVSPFVRDDEPGMWRYAPLLPVQGVAEGFAGDVGQTPVLAQPRLGAELGVELFIKNEGVNPSGSFKDRGLAVGVALGLACGAERACLPTQGCAGVSAAIFCARAGMPGPLVYMPARHRGTRYHRAASAFGAEVRFHGAHLGEAGAHMRTVLAAELASRRYLDLSTFVEPGRLEGKKTMGLEIAESFGDALPDAIVYPTGGGTGLLGIWKAFDELRGLGALSSDVRLPRMIAVQSERCAPLVQAFDAGASDVAAVQSQGTIADGLDVPAVRMGPPLLKVLRDSRGAAVAVSDAAMEEARAELGRQGISASYEGAATLAGLRVLLDRGDVARGSRVLLLITAGLTMA